MKPMAIQPPPMRSGPRRAGESRTRRIYPAGTVGQTGEGPAGPDRRTSGPGPVGRGRWGGDSQWSGEISLSCASSDWDWK